MQRGLTVLFVNFNDKFSHTEHFEKRMLEVFIKWKNWKELRNCELTNSPGKK